MELLQPTPTQKPIPAKSYEKRPNWLEWAGTGLKVVDVSTKRAHLVGVHPSSRYIARPVRAAVVGHDDLITQTGLFDSETGPLNASSQSVGLVETGHHDGQLKGFAQGTIVLATGCLGTRRSLRITDSPARKIEGFPTHP